MSPSQQVRAGLAAEWLKLRSSPVPVVAALLLTVGVVAVSVATLLAPAGEGGFAAKASAMVSARDWSTLFLVAGQVVSVGGLLAFGVVAGWLFGREFTDGTVAGLYALPVSRPAIAAAKLAMLLAWASLVGPVLGGALLLAGWALDLEPGGGSIVALLARLVVTTELTVLLAVPCALVATWTRGYLAAIGCVVTLVVISQVAVTAGVGGWFPFAAPGLWATSASPRPDAQLAVQLFLVVPVAAVASALTIRAWRLLTL